MHAQNICLIQECIKQWYVLTCVSEVMLPHSGCIMRGWSPSPVQYSVGGPRTDPCVSDYHPEFGCGPDLACCNLLVYSSSQMTPDSHDSCSGLAHFQKCDLFNDDNDCTFLKYSLGITQFHRFFYYPFKGWFFSLIFPWGF
jgi:hypothetical protein